MKQWLAIMLRSRISLLVAGLLAVAVVAVTMLIDSAAGFRSEDMPSLASRPIRLSSPAPAIRRLGFRDSAQSAGIDFRMNFLPGEQGENFKVNLYDHGCGLAVGDCDGDGYDDVYFCNQLGSNALYRNKGDGTFEDITAVAGAVGLDDRVSVAATFSDYDNDGDQDLFVTSVRGGNVLLQNDGQARFRDVSVEAGVDAIAHSQTGTFFDYDLDGDLDLLVTNSAEWTTNELDESRRYYIGPASISTIASSPKERNFLYRNNGNGTFSDVTESSGLGGMGWASDAVILDYDEDGLSDVLITNMFGLAQLYQNRGNGAFRDVTEATLGRTSYGSVGAKALDFNNDGRLDLFLADMHSDMWMGPGFDPSLINEAAKYVPGDPLRPGITKSIIEQERTMADRMGQDYSRLVFGNTLFKNLGGGKFEEISDRAGAETFWPWGIAAGDFDNDGDVDMFLPSGMGYPFFYWRNYLLVNNGDETFTDEAAELGLDPPPGGRYLPQSIGGRPAARSSRAAAVADFDRDGRLDLIVNNFNDRPYLYRNEAPAQNYLKFRLRGTVSNRDAVGALVRVKVGDKTLVRQVVSASGYLSQSSKTLHFGLGGQSCVEHVEVRWPCGRVQVVEVREINTIHEVVEDTAAS